MKFENICTRRDYTTKDGKEKTKWFQVGLLKTSDDGKRFIELNMFPQTNFYVFEPKKEEGTVDL